MPRLTGSWAQCLLAVVPLGKRPEMAGKWGSPLHAVPFLLPFSPGLRHTELHWTPRCLLGKVHAGSQSSEKLPHFISDRRRFPNVLAPLSLSVVPLGLISVCVQICFRYPWTAGTSARYSAVSQAEPSSIRPHLSSTAAQALHPARSLCSLAVDSSRSPSCFHDFEAISYKTTWLNMHLPPSWTGFLR